MIKKRKHSKVDEIDVTNLEEETKAAEYDEATFEKPKRKYTKRKKENGAATASPIGSILKGIGGMVASLSSSFAKVEKPISTEESQMLEYVGDCMSTYGDTSVLDEQIGKYSMYLALGSLAVIAVSRFLMKSTNSKTDAPNTGV